jgi:hypothetical protein
VISPANFSLFYFRKWKALANLGGILAVVFFVAVLLICIFSLVACLGEVLPFMLLCVVGIIGLGIFGMFTLFALAARFAKKMEHFYIISVYIRKFEQIISEKLQLIEAGFEFVNSDPDGTQYFRKRK